MKDLHGQSGWGWIGVDLDGTLAHYDGWKGVEHIGPPILAMLERVLHWLHAGREVRIFTARVAPGADAEVAREYIHAWCDRYVGARLVVTHEKDRAMVELWDDRAVQVEPNTGRRLDGIHDIAFVISMGIAKK